MKRVLGRLLAAVLTLALLVTPSLALSVEQAVELLEGFYVDALPPEAYQAETVDELLALLGDPYTEYMTEEEYQRFLSNMEGGEAFVGIGVYIQLTDEGILIDSLIGGGGAEAAGLMAGDVIIAVGGVSCVPAASAHQALILGEEGSYVTLTVRRANGVVSDYLVQRRAVVIPNTTVEVIGGHIGYVDCDSFGEETGSLFRAGVSQYDWQADIWLVDLRGNTGGWTQSAVDGVGAFAGAGDHLIYKNRGGLSKESYFGAPSTRDRAVVLVNGYSASASELMTAGLRDQMGAVSVGSRTYGKGVAQLVLDERGVNGYFDGDALKVTAYRFYSPMGTTNDTLGVIPTLLVDNGWDEEVALRLCGGATEAATHCLRLELNGQFYYVDLSQTSIPAIEGLLASLPPDVPLWLGRGGVWEPATVGGLEAEYCLVVDSRWFDDVADSPYADAINTLGTYQILGGVADGIFQPDGQLTRAQMAALLDQALGCPPMYGSVYSDVHPNAWYGPAVEAVRRMGLMEGVGNELFDPNGILTQEQFITIMGRLAVWLNCFVEEYQQGLEADTLAADPVLAPYADWAREGVAVLDRSADAIFTEGGSMLYAHPADIDPKAPVLREQAAATLYNVLTTLGILAY